MKIENTKSISEAESRKRVSYRGYIIRPRKSDDGELYYDIIKPKWSTTEPIWDWCDSVEEAKQWIDSDKDEPFEESASGEDWVKSDFVFEINRYGHIIVTDLKSLSESKSIKESEGRKATRTSTVYLVDYEDGLSLPFDDRDTAIDYAIDSDAKQVVKATMYHFSDDESDTDIDGDNSEVIWTAYPNPTTENLEESSSDDEDTSMLEKMTNEGYDPLDVYSIYEIKNADTDEVIRKIHTTSMDPDDSSTWFDDDDIISQFAGDGIIITRYDYDQGMLDGSEILYPEESEEIDESVVIETKSEDYDSELNDCDEFKFGVNENFRFRQSNGIIG